MKLVQYDPIEPQAVESTKSAFYHNHDLEPRTNG